MQQQDNNEIGARLRLVLMQQDTNINTEHYKIIQSLLLHLVEGEREQGFLVLVP